MEAHPECGATGCRQVDRDGNVKPSARNFPTPWRIFLTKMGWAGKLPFWKDISDMSHGHDRVMECDWVVGCFLVVRKDIVDGFGYFLRPDYFMYNDDNDLCLRLKRQGWKTYFLPENVIHLGGANMEKIARLSEDEQRVERLTIESDYVYFRKNYNILCTAYHFVLIVLFDVIQAAKRLILPGRDRNISDLLHHSRAAFRMLWQTRFGSTSIH
jgi:GT2 family glycosyltransferase